MSEQTVYDFPIWEDCPFRLLVPDFMEVRCRVNPFSECSMVIVWDEASQRHVDLSMTKEDMSLPLKDMYARYIKPILYNMMPYHALVNFTESLVQKKLISGDLK